MRLRHALLLNKITAQLGILFSVNCFSNLLSQLTDSCLLRIISTTNNIIRISKNSLKMQKLNLLYHLLLLGCLWIGGCQSNQINVRNTNPLIGRVMYTATNLRVFQQQYVYWQNYLNGKILLAGTPIRIVNFDSQTAIFVDNSDSKYILNWSDEQNPQSDFTQQIHKYFVSEPPLENLIISEDDKEAINIGKIRRGMSKEMVLICYGFPPDTVKPKRSDIWVYWLNSWQKCAVYFENGKVTQIVR